MAHLTFSIDYHTVWGEQVCLCGTVPEMGGYDESRAVSLKYDGDRWHTEITVTEAAEVEYYYFIRQESFIVRKEWGTPRKLAIPDNNCHFHVRDLWKNRPFHSYLFTSAFTDAVFRHKPGIPGLNCFDQSVLLNVICPFVISRQRLAISGDCDFLGNWDPSRALPLNYSGNGEWQIVLDAAGLPAQCEYKFVIIGEESIDAVHWEEGDNRSLTIEKDFGDKTVQAEMSMVFRYPSFQYRGTGTAMPLFSLRSNESYGVGDFGDLRKMIDWAKMTGQQLVQLLPVNDTSATKTWRDSYPYSAISAFALHPIYLCCENLPLDDTELRTSFREEGEKLNSLPMLDYEKVMDLKIRYARELFRLQSEQYLASDDYKAFRQKNRSWLFPYCCFCSLRDRYGSADFRTWNEYAKYDVTLLERMLKQDASAKKEVDFWSFLQYLLHCQFFETRNYAHHKGVALKGDIPIGISRNSADTWANPELFHMDTQTGAPPDNFSFLGQNWGFPTYNWPIMAEDGYSWWIARFRKMADYFDAYRIDHILGFFRIWEIPIDAVQGSLGHFNPALPYWSEEIVAAGIPFDEERMVEPFIHEQFLPELFAEYTEEVKTYYLESSGWQRFRLKPFCDTQRKIKQLFANKDDEKSRRICDGLMSLCAEVLFVCDSKDIQRLHPRITAQFTHSYLFLDPWVKEAYNRLYDEFFYRRHNYFWREEAMRKLPALISSTRMMTCGEDLGMVPDCVPSVMQELQILSLEIERMPKKSHVLFTDLRRVPYLSVCTTSTHDMSPLRLWWTENRELTQRYFNEVLHREGMAPEECGAQLCREIIKHHLRSSSMWVILPLQDWLSMDEELRNPDIASERINIPADPEHYWRYRMHLGLEELLEAKTFNETVTTLSRRL